MPVPGDEGTLRAQGASIEVTVAVGADYAHVQRYLAFAADSSTTSPTLGVADTVGMVDTDREALPVACVVGKVLH
jgi:hypothetical protein